MNNRSRALLSRVLVVLALVCVGVVAVAQTTRSAATAPATGATPAELSEKADKALAEMQAAMREAFDELAAARESGDIQRIDCVNKALTAIKGLVRLGQQSGVELQQAAAAGDATTAEHEFVKLNLASSKVLELATQLKACAGPTVSTETEGDPERKVLSDRDLPPASDDPLSWIGDTEVILQEPAASSPFI